jgi:hypothetical protein
VDNRAMLSCSVKGGPANLRTSSTRASSTSRCLPTASSSPTTSATAS